jgi:membrane-associated phospholipid phosphatase
VGKEDEAQPDQPEDKAKFDPRSSRFLAVIFPAIYAIVLAVVCLVYNIIPGPEFLVLCLFIYASYNNWSRRFIKDWIPFIMIFLSYEAMYGIVGTFSKYYLHNGPLNLELQLFGSIPSLVLQQSIRMPALDYMGAIFYSLHFFAPTIFGFILWRENPKDYWKYTVALAITTYGSLVTFLVYPVAPPWYAVPGVTRILTASVDKTLGVPVYKTIFDFFGSNQFAAFPSLHSALPWLIALFAIKIGRLKGLPVLAFPVGVWFSAVYLGEHYVVDVLAGIAYATCAFIIVEKIIPYIQSRYPDLFKKHKLEQTPKQQWSDSKVAESRPL